MSHFDSENMERIKEEVFQIQNFDSKIKISFEIIV